MENGSRSICLRSLVAEVAGPRLPTDNRKSWLNRAARSAGVSYRQIKGLFYGEISDPLHRSARLLRDAAERDSAAKRAAKDEALSAIRTLMARRDKLAATDPDFFSEEISAIEHALRSMVGTSSPRDIR